MTPASSGTITQKHLLATPDSYIVSREAGDHIIGPEIQSAMLLTLPTEIRQQILKEVRSYPCVQSRHRKHSARLTHQQDHTAKTETRDLGISEAKH
jgi:hypothetical protein